MKICVKTVQLEKQKSTCPVIGIFENGELTPTAKRVDKLCGGKITALHKQMTFKGALGQTFLLSQLTNLPFTELLLVGCGKVEKMTMQNFKKVIVSSARALKTTNTTHAACFLTEISVGKTTLAWKVKQITEATMEGLYQFDLFKSEKEPAFDLSELIIVVDEEAALAACQTALEQGKAIANGVILTKNLANTPSNICTPQFLSDQAKALGKLYRSLSVKILEEKEMQKLGMGALLGVSQGSAEDAKLICIHYQGGNKNEAPVALVGKGVTFDTGGNSLKPADAMVGMKYDMCGAASVLGTLKAVAELKLPINVVGVIPAVENMPGGTAYKPEDILTSMAGITIEVISTDAEGRLALCDAITYCERYKPEVIIDIATLTGAVVIALGVHATGLLSNHDPLAEALLKAGQESNDRAWQLPLWDEYQEQIKSPFADIANVGGRPAGTITAACFLSRFTKQYQWAHLDVAGTAAIMAGTNERMATGRPVPMLTQYLINRCHSKIKT